MSRTLPQCPVSEVCGGCQLQGKSYSEQLKWKQEKVNRLFRDIAPVKPIIGADDQYFYRNKSQISFGKDYKNRVLAGNYVESTHVIVPVRECQIADREANAIFNTVIELVSSFRIPVFDEQSMQGVIRHVMVRNSHDHEEVMVVLVTGSPVFPRKKDFLAALLKKHPSITTVVQNINNRHTSMVLGSRNITWFGKGYITDELCGCSFRLSPHSFYQINHAQTEKLYRTAIDLAELTGKETVLDAYCGIGTIGMSASDRCREVIGVELNKTAVKDAVNNARYNNVRDISFVCDDAGKFMEKMKTEGRRSDVVIMDPPRAGSDTRFLSSMAAMQPEKIVYISCNPVTQLRDIKYLMKKGYQPEIIQPVDMFPFTAHVECIALLCRK